MYDLLFAMCASAIAASAKSDSIVFDFSTCTFLHQNGVALLGGLFQEVQRRGCKVEVMLVGCPVDVRENLRKNGFLQSFGLGEGPIGRNTIPFRHDEVRDDNDYLSYLRDEWLGRNWVAVSGRLSDAIANAVWESYTNAFEHGRPASGVFSCGQFYPHLKQIELTMVDYGFGVPETVRTVPQARGFDDAEAIVWALRSGNTSKTGNRGMGLDILSAFVAINGGRMDVVSHAGHVIVDRGGHRSITRPISFQGTLVNILLNADESRYVFQDELTDGELF